MNNYKSKAETIAGLSFRHFSVDAGLHLAQFLVAFVAQFGVVHCIFDDVIRCIIFYFKGAHGLWQLTSVDFDFNGVRSPRQKYWAWLAPIAKRPLAVPLMSHIDVAVALGNHAEVFTFSHVALARHSEQAPSALAFRNGLADLLAGGGVLWLPTLWRQLGDGTGRAERPLEVLLIRALSAGVGVHLGVDDDVDILAAGQHVVEAAESDIIAPTVAAEDPLALLDEAVTEFEELLADVAAAGFHQRDELVGDFLGLEGTITFSK